jgi:hypothetical protein
VKYVPMNYLGDGLSKGITELVWSRYPTITVVGNEAQQKAIDRLTKLLLIRNLVKPTSIACSYAGHCAWRMRIHPNTGEPTLQIWGAEHGQTYTIESFDGSPAHAIAVSLWHTRAIAGGKKVAVQERFTHVLDAKGRIQPGVTHETRAYKANDDGSIGESPVGLEYVYPEASRPEPEVLYPALTRLPVFLIHNPDLDGDGWGDSDYSDGLISWQHEYNLTYARRSYSLRLKSSPRVTVDPALADAGGGIDLDSAMIQYRTPDGDMASMEVKADNWDAALAESAVQIDKLREDWYTLTPLTPALVGDVKGGESGTSRRLSLTSTIATVYDRRQQAEPALMWAYQCAQELEAMTGTADAPVVEDMSFLWAPPIPEDLEEMEANSRTTINEVRANLRSLELAVARLNPTMTKAQVLEELDRLLALEEARQEAQTQNPGL